MENSNIGQHLTFCSQETSEPKTCWICLCTDNDDNDYENNRNWVSPCKCRYSSRWVHQACLLRWIDEKLKENLSFEAHCPQCRTQYSISYDEVNYLVRLLNTLDITAIKICRFLTAGVVVVTCYWSAVCYGIITIMQIIGEREAITMMENTNTYMLLVVLPTIPLSLILLKLIDWEETLLLFVQRFASQIPLLRIILPSFLCEPVNSRTTEQSYSVSISFATLCSTFLLPTNAIVVGNLLFGNSSYSCLKKTLLGGLVYIAVKSVVRIYQRQQNLRKNKILKIIEYRKTDDEN